MYLTEQDKQRRYSNPRYWRSKYEEVQKLNIILNKQLTETLVLLREARIGKETVKNIKENRKVPEFDNERKV